MREGQYTFSASLKKNPNLVELGDEYRVLSIQTGISFSTLVFRAMSYYKQEGLLPRRAHVEGGLPNGKENTSGR